MLPLSIDSGQQASLFGQQPAEQVDLGWQRLHGIYQQHWQDYGYDNQAEAQQFKTLGQTMLKNFQQSLAASSLPTVVWLEKPFAFRLKDFVIRGTIDRLDKMADGSYQIIDYKTGRPKDKVYFPDKEQLLLYQLAVSELLPQTISSLTYDFLQGQPVSFTATDKDLLKTRETIIKTVNDLRQFDFTSLADDHTCQYCDWRGKSRFRAT